MNLIRRDYRLFAIVKSDFCGMNRLDLRMVKLGKALLDEFLRLVLREGISPLLFMTITLKKTGPLKR